ncbi:DUF2635 domain-containing protein [bacterium]|nr:DUF2635 domain-containing protein [bacterium]
MPAQGERVTVYPAEGRRVRHPHTAMVIPATGQAVAWAPYWRRRLKQGDITLDAPVPSDGDQSKVAPKQGANGGGSPTRPKKTSKPAEASLGAGEDTDAGGSK